MLKVQDYTRAASIEETLDILHNDPSAQLLAGGTDLLLHGDASGAGMTLVDISDIPELQGIHPTSEGVRIGAATKMVDIMQSGLLTGPLDCLVQGAAEVGSLQIRHMATLGGNLSNASPSADTAAPLLAMEASVEVQSARSQRDIPLDEFLIGPGECALEPDELLVAVYIPTPAPQGVGVYLKHKVREVLDLAIVGVAVAMWEVEGGLQSRIALAAVAPTPIRVPGAEDFLAGAEVLDEQAVEEAARLAVEAASPIDDVRGTAQYRKEMVYKLTKTALSQAWAGLQRQKSHGA